MLSKSNISFNIDDCPNEQTLRNYQKGSLTREQIRMVENHLADCEICSDFVEGFSLFSNETELESEVQLIVSKIFNKVSKKNKIWLYATAASLFIAVALTSLIILLPSKNNYVADETIKQILKDEEPNTGVNKVDNLGWIKDVTEVSGKDADKEKKAIEKTIDSRSNKQAIIMDNEDTNIPLQETAESDEIVLNEQTNIGVVDKVTANDLKESEKVQSYTEIAGGAVVDQKRLEAADVSKESQTKTYKKNKADQSERKSENAKGVFSGDMQTGQASVPSRSAEESITTISAGASAINDESNGLFSSDLEKANDFLNKSQLDSTIVYALKGINSSNYNNKWKSKLCLAKAYIIKGEKDKAKEILKEIKAKASYRISKDADAELEKLGN